MFKIKFVSNNDELRNALPFSPVPRLTIPDIGHIVRLNKQVEGKVLTITHPINEKDCDVEIYLTPKD